MGGVGYKAWNKLKKEAWNLGAYPNPKSGVLDDSGHIVISYIAGNLERLSFSHSTLPNLTTTEERRKIIKKMLNKISKEVRNRPNKKPHDATHAGRSIDSGEIDYYLSSSDGSFLIWVGDNWRPLSFGLAGSVLMPVGMESGTERRARMKT